MTKLSIGRDNDNDIVFSDNSVSRMHGFIFFEEDSEIPKFMKQFNKATGLSLKKQDFLEI